MTSVKEDNPDLSPTSPVDDSDAVLSPVPEPEPIPGLNGVPVRCKWLSYGIIRTYRLNKYYRLGYDVSIVPACQMVLRLFSFLRERRIAQNHTRELRLFKRDMIPVLSEFTANHNVNLLYSCQQVLLQTSHIVCPCLWLDHLGVCCNYPGCIGRRPRQTKSVRFFFEILPAFLQLDPQWSICCNCLVLDIFHDSVPWWSIYSASSFILENCTGGKFAVRIRPRFFAVSGFGHCSGDDDFYWPELGRPPTWKELRRRLRADGTNHLGLSMNAPLESLTKSGLECPWYILRRPYTGLVW